MMRPFRGGDWLHKVFEASLLAKGLFAAAEIVAGLAIQLAPASRLQGMAMRLAEAHVVKDVAGPMVRRAEALVQHFGGPQQHFYAVYLLSHGIAKMGIVLLLAARIPAAYPLGIVLQLAFIAYQMERWSHTHSGIMLAASILDAVIILLIWREWRAARPARA